MFNDLKFCDWRWCFVAVLPCSCLNWGCHRKTSAGTLIWIFFTNPTIVVKWSKAFLGTYNACTWMSRAGISHCRHRGWSGRKSLLAPTTLAHRCRELASVTVNYTWYQARLVNFGSTVDCHRHDIFPAVHINLPSFAYKCTLHRADERPVTAVLTVIIQYKIQCIPLVAW